MSVVSLQGVSKSFGDHVAVDNLSLDIVKGEFLTLLGPSGCGKTTVLRLIAGLESCDGGKILIGRQDHTQTPACDRDVNTVFQSYALFPHMDVFDNIAFGLTLKKMPTPQIRERVENALEMVKLSGMGKRRINQLSGGQQQRVAIARALVNQPLILLLDEPLSALDYQLRKQMRLELRQLHRELGITFIFVTHDQEEAITMSDRVVVMNKGKIEQAGSPKDIYEEPVNMFVADFVGESNVFDAEVISVTGPDMKIRMGQVVKTVSNTKACTPGQRVKVLLRPEDMTVERLESGHCPEDVFPGRVEEMIYKGTTVELIIRLDNGQKILSLEFFNEDAEDIFYDTGERVCMSWFKGWEVILCNG